MNRDSTFALYALLLSALAAGVALSLAVGPVSLTVAQIWQGLVMGDGWEAVILREIRLPRVWLALLAGGALGMAGAALQGYLRNPLAEPGLLGVTNGAALGAVFAMYGGPGLLGFSAGFLLPVMAMGGAMLAVALACLLVGRHTSAYALILAGIAVSSLFGAAVALALNLAPNPFAAMEVVFWLMGSLEARSMHEVWLALPCVLAGMVLMLSCARGLDALTLGEQTAASLGISLASLRWRLVAGVSLAVGGVTAVAGSIGFVGLVVPHVLRPFVGARPGRLLPASALGGAVMVLLADTLLRAIPTTGMELRLGVVTALVGAPFFLWLLLHERRRGQT